GLANARSTLHSWRIVHDGFGRIDTQPEQGRHYVHSAKGQEVYRPTMWLAEVLEYHARRRASHETAQIADRAHAARYDPRVALADVQAHSPRRAHRQVVGKGGQGDSQHEQPRVARVQAQEITQGAQAMPGDAIDAPAPLAIAGALD